jgi:NTE family protein
LIDNVPVSVAREKGADIVIAVDIGKQVSNFNVVNIIDVMLQSIAIMNAENASFRRREATVLIEPRIGDVGMLDFTQKKRCMQAGIEATQKVMPEIKMAIAAWEKDQLAKR